MPNGTAQHFQNLSRKTVPISWSLISADDDEYEDDNSTGKKRISDLCRLFQEHIEKKSKNRKALPIKCKEIETGW